MISRIVTTVELGIANWVSMVETISSLILYSCPHYKEIIILVFCHLVSMRETLRIHQVQRKTDIDGEVRIIGDYIDIGADERWYVHNTTQDTHFATIAPAIAQAANGDVIVLKPTTYVGTGNRDLNFGGKAITIRSEDPADPDVVASTVIDCEGTRTEPHRGFLFNSGEGQDSIIDGLTITNGYGLKVNALAPHLGGAIVCRLASSPTIKRCVITGNGDDTGNSDVEAGGIACVNNSAPLIENCVITDNGAYYSGGIACYSGSSPTIKNSVIANNSAYYGGGIYFYDDADATVLNCTIASNDGIDYGGGLLCWNSSPVISNTILWGNTATRLNPQSALEDVNSQPSFQLL